MSAEILFSGWGSAEMFRNRQSQKPSDDLYKSFKANFPQFGQSGAETSASVDAATSLADALDGPSASSIGPHLEDLKDADPTPKASIESWNLANSGFTPSMMDPNSHSFSMFANQMPGYYTPTSGGMNTLYHHQAGDLHTPTYHLGLSTPLSMPTSESGLHAAYQAQAYQSFQAQLPHHLQQAGFHDANQFHTQQAFPPHHFTHQPAYETMDHPIEGSPENDMGMTLDLQPVQQSPQSLFHPQYLQNTMPAPRLHPSGEKFRYHVTLNAPTAMIKHSDEIPVTYLNKGQAYTLNVMDTQGPQPALPARYRTFVRVSFEDEQQRAKPAACWQLWKEGRGMNEAHQRGGRLQAVEYVEASQLGGIEDPSKPQIELECASFDGFCVNWTAPPGTVECAISVRFNFLSTDFSHSKGVKGIPVRLCTKTEMIENTPQGSQSVGGAEVCYGKVKLFRDHGAERKLSNDVAHIKKTIDKLNQQISQVESGIRDLGKRKRGSATKSSGDDRPGKVQKHRRTWSMTSMTSSGGRGSAEEDLHMKLMTLQDMFTSTRPASVLYLRGADQDDPDLYPVKLSGEAAMLARTESGETAATSWERQSTQTGPPSSLVSPTPSSKSLSRDNRRDSDAQEPTPIADTSRNNSADWRNRPQMATTDLQATLPQQRASPSENLPVKVQTRSPTSGRLTGWIEAVGVDAAYISPPERPVKPVACFYVQIRVAGRTPPDNLHRAVYVLQRTLKDFVNAIALKSNIEPTAVLQAIRVTRQGLQVLFDDECIRELPEGQDMTAEFSETTPDSALKTKREWDAGPTDIRVDGELSTLENVSSTGYELRLLF